MSRPIQIKTKSTYKMTGTRAWRGQIFGYFEELLHTVYGTTRQEVRAKLSAFKREYRVTMRGTYSQLA